MLIDRSPVSDFVLAKSHGRVDIVLCCANIAMALLFSLQDTLQVSVLVAAVCVFAALHLYLTLYYIPFFNQSCNQYHTLFSAVYCWVAVCTLLAYARGQPEEQVESLVFLLSLPVVAFSGFTFARQRYVRLDKYLDSATATAVGSIPSNALMVELLHRRLISRGLEAQRTAACVVYSHGDSESSGATGTQGQARSIGTGRVQAADKSSTSTSANAAPQRLDVGSGSRRNLQADAATVHAVDRLYETAIATAESSALLQLFFTQHIRYFHGNRHIEERHLKALELMALPFDVAFFMYQRRREIRLADKAKNGSSMSVEAHVKFTRLRQETERQVLNARYYTAQLWSELTNVSPSLSTMDEIACKIEKATSTAIAGYQRMLRMNPNSVATMRRYAEFLKEVLFPFCELLACCVWC